MANKNEEDLIQADMVKWYHNSFCLAHHQPRHVIFSVPNGGDRNKIEAMKMKATGLLAGVSDLIIIQPACVLFIEVKTDTGKQSPKQIQFEDTVKNMNYNYHVVRSLEDFKELVYNYK